MSSQQRLLAYVMAHKGRMVCALFCGLLMTGCTLFVATLIKWFTAVASNESVLDYAIVKFGLRHGWFEPSQAPAALMMAAAGLMVLINIPRSVFAFTNNYLIASVTARIGTDVREDVYAHLQTLPLRFFHRSRIGDILSRMSVDVALIQNSSAIVVQAIDGPLMVIGGLGKMALISWQLTAWTIIFVPLMGLAINRLTRKIRRLTTATQSRFADVSTTIEESIHGVRIIKAFGMEDYEIKRFNRANNNSLAATLRYWRRNAVVAPIVELMGSIAAALLMIIGGRMLVSGSIKFPDLAEFMVLAFYVAGSAKQFGRLGATYQQTLAAGERVFEILDTKSDVPDAPDAVVLKDVEGCVECRNVSFEYNPNEPVIVDLSFKIDPGEVVAIVGPSGAGKSTIADLILRFYDVDAGEIYIEGHDIRQINTRSLREHMAMVPQETILFSGTIAENISYGRPGTDMSDIIDAAKAANAHDFILQCPNGYDTELGEGGVGLSGGQRQRISIARALLKNPKILILDEATSSLDAASEGIVQEALDRLMRGRSTLVIAHRLSTVKNANKIFVMDKGRVIESGSFDELMVSGGLFEQLYKTQFRTQEAK
ncbi:MAG: ABC transporter ATP-binding protein [Armatimonadota bacterium]|nr:ABC transporter ATP-binding protein/permease [bacterium]